jgi:hypothetical protein
MHEFEPGYAVDQRHSLPRMPLMRCRLPSATQIVAYFEPRRTRARLEAFRTYIQDSDAVANGLYGQSLVVGKVANDCIGLGLRQPAECLARWREREEFAGKVVIILDTPRTVSGSSSPAKSSSGSSLRMPVLLFSRRRQPLLHDALRVGRPRAISCAQEDRVEMFLELCGQRTRDYPRRCALLSRIATT